MPLCSPHNGGSGGPGEANMLPGTRDASQHVGWVVAASAVAVTVVVLVLVVVVYPRGGINDVTVRHPSKRRWQPLPNPNPNPRHALADNNGWWGGDECSLLRVCCSRWRCHCRCRCRVIAICATRRMINEISKHLSTAAARNSPRRRKRKVKNFSCRE